VPSKSFLGIVHYIKTPKRCVRSRGISRDPLTKSHAHLTRISRASRVHPVHIPRASYANPAYIPAYISTCIPREIQIRFSRKAPLYGSTWLMSSSRLLPNRRPPSMPSYLPLFLAAPPPQALTSAAPWPSAFCASTSAFTTWSLSLAAPLRIAARIIPPVGICV